ncbi:MAG: hypothetical protein ACREP6_03020 [Candidatus Binataceae bacterium]
MKFDYSTERLKCSFFRAATLISVLSAAMFLCNAPLANAGGLPDLGIDMALAKPLTDAQLGAMRGGFAPNGGQPIIFFGLLVQSTLQGQNGASVSAGAALGVDLKSAIPKVTTNLTWATRNDPGVDPSTPTAGTGVPNSLNFFGGGIGQVVQIAGHGNQALNQASIDVTTASPNNFMPASAPSGMACGNLCQASIKANALQVAVNLPGQGSASQTINPQVILQGIRLNGSMGQATNSMNLFVQLGKSAAFNAAGVATVLQAIPAPIR